MYQSNLKTSEEAQASSLTAGGIHQADHRATSLSERQRLQAIYAKAAPRKSYPARRVIQQMAEDNPETAMEMPTPAPAQVATGDDPRTMEQKEEAVELARKEVIELIDKVEDTDSLSAYFPVIMEKYGLRSLHYEYLGTPQMRIVIAINPIATISGVGGKLTLNTRQDLDGTDGDKLKQRVTFKTDSVQGWATEMKASVLGPFHPEGGPPKANALANTMRDLPTDPKVYPGDENHYVKGHLLNDNLGGPGIAENLFPITGRANKDHSNYVESYVKYWVNDQRAYVYYHVKIDVDAFELNNGINSNYVNATMHCIAHKLDANGKRSSNRDVVDRVIESKLGEWVPVDDTKSDLSYSNSKTYGGAKYSDDKTTEVELASRNVNKKKYKSIPPLFQDKLITAYDAMRGFTSIWLPINELDKSKYSNVNDERSKVLFGATYNLMSGLNKTTSEIYGGIISALINDDEVERYTSVTVNYQNYNQTINKIETHLNEVIQVFNAIKKIGRFVQKGLYDKKGKRLYNNQGMSDSRDSMLRLVFGTDTIPRGAKPFIHILQEQLKGEQTAADAKSYNILTSKLDEIANQEYTTDTSSNTLLPPRHSKYIRDKVYRKAIRDLNQNIDLSTRSHPVVKEVSDNYMVGIDDARKNKKLQKDNKAYKAGHKGYEDAYHELKKLSSTKNMTISSLASAKVESDFLHVLNQFNTGNTAVIKKYRLYARVKDETNTLLKRTKKDKRAHGYMQKKVLELYNAAYAKKSPNDPAFKTVIGKSAKKLYDTYLGKIINAGIGNHAIGSGNRILAIAKSNVADLKDHYRLHGDLSSHEENLAKQRLINELQVAAQTFRNHTGPGFYTGGKMLYKQMVKERYNYIVTKWFGPVYLDVSTVTDPIGLLALHDIYAGLNLNNNYSRKNSEGYLKGRSNKLASLPPIPILPNKP